MEIQKITELIDNNINKIASINGFKNVLNRGNNLIRFDVLNRILIAIQNNKAIDIKTDEEWLILGRKVKDKQKPIYIIMPKYTYQYIDNDSSKAIEINELTQDEIIKALKYNIIHKEERIESLYTIPVYDVKQTTKLEISNYIINKPVLNSKILLELMHSISGATIELCDESYYSTTENIVFIEKKPYKELATVIIEFLTKYLIDNKLKDTVYETSEIDYEDLSEYDIELISLSLKYSMATLFNTNINIDFDVVMHTSNNKIIAILNIVDNLMIDIIQRLQFTQEKDNSDAIYKINKLRKAEAILDIMEANNIRNELNNI